LSSHREPFKRFFGNGFVTQGGAKISKRVGGAATPDELVERYGADATRLSILFIGPADQDMEWTPSGVEGMKRFLRRVWRTVSDVIDSTTDGASGETVLARKTHRTIARATDDIGRRQSFNTAIAALMELVNELSKAGPTDPAARFAAESAVSLIQPYAPHVAEELWERLGHERLWEHPWPEADPALLEEDTFELVVQVNGKVRDASRFRPIYPSMSSRRAKEAEGADAAERRGDPADDQSAASVNSSSTDLIRAIMDT
jgi:leucyl-tRNA synthetase